MKIESMSAASATRLVLSLVGTVLYLLAAGFVLGVGAMFGKGAVNLERVCDILTFYVYLPSLALGTVELFIAKEQRQLQGAVDLRVLFAPWHAIITCTTLLALTAGWYCFVSSQPVFLLGPLAAAIWFVGRSVEAIKAIDIMTDVRIQARREARSSVHAS